MLLSFDAYLWEPGDRRVVFHHPLFAFSTPICFEDVFPDDVRRFVREGAEVILNLSNDYWSLTEAEGMQHAANAVFRAVENGRPIARAAASGLTCMVDTHGRITARSPFYTESFLVVDVPLSSSRADALYPMGRLVSRLPGGAGLPAGCLEFRVAGSKMKRRIGALYTELLSAYGPQGWWPLPSKAGKRGFDARGYHPGAYGQPRTAEDRFEVVMGAVLTQSSAWTNAEIALGRLHDAGIRLPADVRACPQGRLARLIRSIGLLQPESQEAEGGCRALSLCQRPLPQEPHRQGRRSSPAGVSSPETADSILLYAFRMPFFVIDAYTRRLLVRTGLIPGAPRQGYDGLQRIFLDSLPHNHELFNEYHALIVEHAKRHCRAQAPLRRVPRSSSAATGIPPPAVALNATELRGVRSTAQMAGARFARCDHLCHARHRGRLEPARVLRHTLAPWKPRKASSSAGTCAWTSSPASLPSKVRMTGFAPGDLSIVGAPVISTGGAVSNVGLGLHSLGLPVRLAARIGDDAFGKLVWDRVTASGAGLAEGIRRVRGEVTSYTVVLNPPGVDRVFFHCPGANDTFTDLDVTDQVLAEAAIVHFGYPPLMQKIWSDGGTALVRLLTRARACGARTSLDMSLPDPKSPSGRIDWNAFLERVLPHVDFFVPSVEELLFMTDRPRYESLGAQAGGESIIRDVSFSDLGRLADASLTWGASAVLLKLGDRGAYLRTGSSGPRDLEGWAGRELYAPVFAVPAPAGTAGAGDATIAGFLASVYKCFSPENALTMAVAVGGSCVEAPDAVSGIRSWDETVRSVRGGWARASAPVAAPGWRA